MRRFWERRRKNEITEEDARITEQKIRDDIESYETNYSLNEQGTKNALDGDLRCEEAIMEDKKQFGRVRNSLMKYLRAKYGSDIADRALWRVTKRMYDGHLNQ